MHQTQTFNYRNITISGIAGTGSTTLLNQLRTALQPYGWQGFSGGEYMRQFVDEFQPGTQGHHSAADYGENVDRMVDMSIRQRLQSEEGLIIESWLSGFMAQGIPGVLKILLICTNELDRAHRLAERDGMESDEAMIQAFRRLETNVNRWSEMYSHEWDEWVVKTGKLPARVSHFFWHQELYDLVIDTAICDTRQALDITMNQLISTEIVVPKG
ncbi:MAG TPA: hypothetical protein VJZ27_15960 [Aggregatilineales bacterium]|nr:hypothetical protein [Aggregatilineales bacterium]